MPYWVIPVLMLVCLMNVTDACAQSLSEENARELARAVVTSRSRTIFLSTYREEALETRFRALTAKPKDAALFVFALSQEGTEFLENGGTRQHNPSDGPLTWLIATLPSSGKVFDIREREGFNTLASALNVRISDDSQAQDYLYLYLDLHPEHGIFDEVVFTPLQLKQTAETQFARAYDDLGRAEIAFDAWWKRNSALLRVPLARSFSKTDDGFLAKFYAVSAVSKKDIAAGPALLEVRLPISRDGIIGEAKFTPIQ